MSEHELPSIIAGDEAIRDWELWGHMNSERRVNLDRAEVLEIPISLIEDDDLRAFTLFLVAQAHPTWWEIPSSSTLKYHPDWENVVSTVPEYSSQPMGGLMKHIFGVLVLALDGLRRHGIDPERPGTEKDRIAELRDALVFAVLLHDWAKNGDPCNREGRQPWGEHTFKYHGEVCAELLLEDQLPRFIDHCSEIADEKGLRRMVGEAAEAIRHHYGVWSQEGHKPQAITVDVNDLIEALIAATNDPAIDAIDASNAKAAAIRQFVRPRLSVLAVVLHEADYYCSRKYMAFPDPRAVKEFLYKVSPANLRRVTKTK